MILHPAGNTAEESLRPAPVVTQSMRGGRRGRRAAGPAPVAAAPAAAPAGSGRVRLERDALRLSVVGLLIMTISRIHQHFGILTTLRASLLLTLMTAAVAYMNPKLIRHGSLLETWPAKLIAALGVMACLSVPFGISMGASGRFILESYSKVLIGAFIVIVAVRRVSDLYTLVVGCVLGGGILSILSLFVFPVESIGGDGFARISKGYSFDANDLGTMAVTVLPLALWLIATRRGAVRMIAIATSIGLVATLAKSGSRGGFLGLLAIGVALLLLARTVPVWKRVAVVALAAGGLFIAAPPGYWKQMETISSPKDDYNWTAPTGRRQIWKRGMGYMWSHPLTGIGVSNFPKAEGTISPLAQNFRAGMAGIKWSAAHNSFVEVGAEMGLPGLLLFSGLVLGTIGSMYRMSWRLPGTWRSGNEEQRFLAHAPTYLLVSMVGFASAGFFVSFAYWDIPYVVAALVAGVYVCVADQQRRAMPAPVPVPGRG